MLQGIWGPADDIHMHAFTFTYPRSFTLRPNPVKMSDQLPFRSDSDNNNEGENNDSDAGTSNFPIRDAIHTALLQDLDSQQHTIIVLDNLRQCFETHNISLKAENDNLRSLVATLMKRDADSPPSQDSDAAYFLSLHQELARKHEIIEELEVAKHMIAKELEEAKQSVDKVEEKHKMELQWARSGKWCLEGFVDKLEKKNGVLENAKQAVEGRNEILEMLNGNLEALVGSLKKRVGIEMNRVDDLEKHSAVKDKLITSQERLLMGQDKTIMEKNQSIKTLKREKKRLKNDRRVFKKERRMVVARVEESDGEREDEAEGQDSECEDQGEWLVGEEVVMDEAIN
ncbi:hypothetical protein LTR97_004748 [Elasticomyces elasticus]|uniref:Uncharacterized protein n=1 Tax=Elasticomyces elasticus TaxID=574655 RepID=A0AAN7W8X4_9PEZI|nr:hypothetical protein LTR97_004748 [Elasticomyces elasticus]